MNIFQHKRFFIKLVLQSDNAFPESKMHEKIGVTSFVLNVSMWKNTLTLKRWQKKLNMVSTGFSYKHLVVESTEAIHLVI